MSKSINLLIVFILIFQVPFSAQAGLFSALLEDLFMNHKKVVIKSKCTSVDGKYKIKFRRTNYRSLNENLGDVNEVSISDIETGETVESKDSDGLKIEGPFVEIGHTNDKKTEIEFLVDFDRYDNVDNYVSIKTKCETKLSPRHLNQF